MSEQEKRDTLELIKRLPPEKQTYIAGIATGLAMSEPEPSKQEAQAGAEGAPDEGEKPA